MFIDTLHPVHEGRVFRWERDKLAATVSEYGRSAEGEAAGAEVLFPWEVGITEFVATVNRFSADGAIGEMDCFYAGWMTDR